jgi:simple sugar transport system permease protein
MSAPLELPRWVDVILVPALAVIAAFVVAGVVVLAIGQNPLEATYLLLRGALGSGEGIGFTLYYATNFIFTGLAVAVAYHAGLFNIGAEGQATLGGLGATLVCLHLDALPAIVLIPLAIVAAALFGAAWAFIPAWLQAKRGSHIVITTMMFNFIAYALMNYVLVNMLRPMGSMDPASARFDAKYLVRGAPTEVPEGQFPSRIVVMEFPSPGAARECYRSSDYARAIALRQGKAKMNLAIIEGYDGPQPGEPPRP